MALFRVVVSPKAADARAAPTPHSSCAPLEQSADSLGALAVLDNSTRIPRPLSERFQHLRLLKISFVFLASPFSLLELHCCHCKFALCCTVGRQTDSPMNAQNAATDPSIQRASC
jgi:hypothetical protein